MHLPIANDENNYENFEGLFIKAIRTIEGYIRELREGNKRNPRRYHLPIIKSYKTEVVTNGILTFNVSIAKYGTYKFPFSLPVFMNLEPKCVQQDKIDNYAESQKIRDDFDRTVTSRPFVKTKNEEFITSLLYNKFVLT